MEDLFYCPECEGPFLLDEMRYFWDEDGEKSLICEECYLHTCYEEDYDEPFDRDGWDDEDAFGSCGWGMDETYGSFDEEW